MYFSLNYFVTSKICQFSNRITEIETFWWLISWPAAHWERQLFLFDWASRGINIWMVGSENVDYSGYNLDIIFYSCGQYCGAIWRRGGLGQGRGHHTVVEGSVVA